MQPETKRFILDVLQAQNILTLATVREDGYPQATRVGVAARKQPPAIVPDRHRERLTRGWRARSRSSSPRRSGLKALREEMVDERDAVLTKIISRHSACPSPALSTWRIACGDPPQAA
jgi:Pyridoxamine 5'-phosphate oxidase